MSANKKKCKICDNNQIIDKFYIYSEKDLNRNLKCVDCIADLYLLKKYNTFCKQCGYPAKLDTNEVCKKCNKNNGLYQCRECSKILPLFFSFDGKHRQCKWCMKKKRKYRIFQIKNDNSAQS